MALGIIETVLTKKQIAEKLNVSVRVIGYWMKAKTIPYFKIGGMVRFDEAEVEAALRQYRVKARVQS